MERLKDLFGKKNFNLTEKIIMKTLILNGSPRTNGVTSSLINKFTEKIGCEYRM